MASDCCGRPPPAARTTVQPSTMATTAGHLNPGLHADPDTAITLPVGRFRRSWLDGGLVGDVPARERPGEPARAIELVPGAVDGILQRAVGLPHRRDDGERV